MMSGESSESAACRDRSEELRHQKACPTRAIAAALRYFGFSKPAPYLPGRSGHHPERRLLDDLIAAMAREGSALVGEGIISRTSDIDLVLVHGYGFPRIEGGPMWATNSRAATAVQAFDNERRSRAIDRNASSSGDGAPYANAS